MLNERANYAGFVYYFTALICDFFGQGTFIRLSWRYYHNGMFCIMENTATSDLLLHDKPLIRKIIGWKWNLYLYRQASEPRRMEADLNTLENWHRQMQNLSLYSKFSLEIDRETSRSHIKVFLQWKGPNSWEKYLWYTKVITHFQMIHSSCYTVRPTLHPCENKNVLKLNKMVNVLHFLLHIWFNFGNLQSLGPLMYC